MSDHITRELRSVTRARVLDTRPHQARSKPAATDLRRRRVARAGSQHQRERPAATDHPPSCRRALHHHCRRATLPCTPAARCGAIRAIVHEPADVSDLRVLQIVENDQRVDVSPLEQARAYQALLDETSWTVEELGQRIGKPPYRIVDRLVLLKLRDEYQQLLAGRHLGASQAFEMSRLSQRSQDVLFKAIKHGRCKTWHDLRACANALVEAESQTVLLPAAEPPSDEERAAVCSFEGMVERVGAMLRAGVRDN